MSPRFVGMTLKPDQLSKSLIRRIEARTGKSADELKSETLWQKRVRLTSAKGRSMQFTRNFPLIGRGCVLGDHLVTTCDLNRDIDRLLSSR
jgi:hypothetical protein